MFKVRDLRYENNEIYIIDNLCSLRLYNDGG